MFTHPLFWPWFTGVIFLLAGLLSVRKDWLLAGGLDNAVVLGPVFVAAPLATFGAEHLVSAQFIMQIVPAWMPGRLFWAYFVGLALFAAAISLLLKKHVRLSATLLGVMFFLFVLSIHLPNAAAKPGDRFAWAVAVRDFTFGVGAFALAAKQAPDWRPGGTKRLVSACRICFALAILFFGVEHFLHPEFAPGVPLPKKTPTWVPFPILWGYLVGAILLVASVALVLDKNPRAAATWLGLTMTVLAFFFYMPMLAVAAKPSEINEAVNYIADTLLFGGAILLLASAMPPSLQKAGGPDYIRA